MAKSWRILRRKNKSRRGGSELQPNSAGQVKVEVSPVPTNMTETKIENKSGFPLTDESIVPPTVMTAPETGNQVTEIIQKLQEIINMYKPKK